MRVALTSRTTDMARSTVDTRAALSQEPAMAIPSSDLAPTSSARAIRQPRRYLDQAFSGLTRVLGFTPPSLENAQLAHQPSADRHDDGEMTTIRVELRRLDIADVTVESPMVSSRFPKKKA